ncbi:MAG: hypothetical protein AAB477_00600 [Patescibacteria group bacterium]
MINDELIAYIQTQTRKNISKDTIVSKLTNTGWHADDIDEAFRKLTPPKIVENPTTPTVNKAPVISDGPDLYRELPGRDEPGAMNLAEVLGGSALQNEPGPIKPIFSTSFSEANPKNPTPSYYIPDNVTPSDKKKDEKNETNINFGVMRPKLVQVPPSQIPNPPTLPPSPSFSQPKPQNSDGEFLPSLKPKTVSSAIELKDFKLNEDKASTPSVIPQNAILHSYPQILSSSVDAQESFFTRKKKSLLKILIIVLIISFISGAIFVFANNYIKLPSFNFPFIKKDPKVLLANAPTILSSLKSYKIETVVTLSTPPFADITNGLVSGEAVPSHQRDSISLSAKGSVNNNNQSTPTFDYLANIRSSLLKNDISYGIKYIDNKVFITMPNLVAFLGSNAPKESVVVTDQTQTDSMVGLLPVNIQSKAEKVDINKFLSTILPSYITDETASIFKDFVLESSVLEKDPEKIHGVEAYYYVLNSSRPSLKKLLNSFAVIFAKNLSSNDSSYLSDLAGSITIDNLGVWIGKDDSNIHQYEFTLSAPLSKVIGLEDKGIAGNTVSLNWKTTYYDFDITNNIEIPQTAITTSDFIKSIKDMEIKNLIYDFKPAADTLHNAIGSFGKRSNINGSCTTPTSGSLFSPVGHPKGANNAVSNISSVITGILDKNSGVLSCYSTPNAWALSLPLVSNPNSFFCLDSTGTTEILNTSLTSTACK